MEKLIMILPNLIIGIREALKIVAGGGMYRRFFDKANALFMIANLNGRIMKINEAFAKELGYTPQELEGKAFMLFVYQNDHKKTLDAMDTLRAGGEIPNGVFHNRYYCKDGTLKTLEWTAMTNGQIYATARVIATK